MATNNSINCDYPIEVACGGTGVSSITDGAFILGSGANAVTELGPLAKGGLIVGDGTTDPQELSVGTNDYILTADSTQTLGMKWAVNTGSSGSPVLIEEQTPSAAAQVDFTSSIDSTYNIYMFELVELYTSSDNDWLRMRTSSDTGSTFDNGSGEYHYKVINDTTSTSSTYISIAQNVGGSTSRPERALSGYVYLYVPSGTTYYKRVLSAVVYPDAGSGTPDIRGRYNVGARYSTAIIDAVRFYFGSGNMTGTIRLYGLSG